jgi:DNA-directed RNA polymerase specialized sigma24 family protein
VRLKGVGTQRPDFAEFYRRSRDDCLRVVLISVGDPDTAQELVADAFARACASWRTVSRHPAPASWVVRTALNMNISRWRRRHREVPVPDPSRIADRPAADAAAGNAVAHAWVNTRQPRRLGRELTHSAVSRNQVALCDGHGVPSWPPAGSWWPPTLDGGKDWRKIKQPRESGMLTEPCRGVFTQSGRWIFV